MPWEECREINAYVKRLEKILLHTMKEISRRRKKNRNFRLYFHGRTEPEERSEISFKVAIPNVMANLEETRFGILNGRETQLLLL